MTEAGYPYEVFDAADAEDLNTPKDEQPEEELQDGDTFNYDVLNKFYYEYPKVSYVVDNACKGYNYAKSNKFAKRAISIVERPVVYVAGTLNKTFEPQLKKVDQIALDKIEKLENGIANIRSFPERVLETSEEYVEEYLPTTSTKKKYRNRELKYRTRLFNLIKRVIEGVCLIVLRLIAFFIILGLSLVNAFYEKVIKKAGKRILEIRLVQKGLILVGKTLDYFVGLGRSFLDYLSSFTLVTKTVDFILQLLTDLYNKLRTFNLRSAFTRKPKKQNDENEEEDQKDEEEEEKEKEEEKKDEKDDEDSSSSDSD